MADDDDLSLDGEEAETTEAEVETVAPEGESPDLSKLRRENHSLRTRLRRTELSAKYGADVLELIPEELPLAKWDEYAGKLSDRLRKPETDTGTEQATEEAPKEEPTPQEHALAAVTKGPASGTSGLSLDMSAKEILELGKKDPTRADQIRQAKYRTP